MKISNIILPGTLAKLKTTAYGYKITNSTDNTEAYISSCLLYTSDAADE